MSAVKIQLPSVYLDIAFAGIRLASADTYAPGFDLDLRVSAYLDFGVSKPANITWIIRLLRIKLDVIVCLSVCECPDADLIAPDLYVGVYAYFNVGVTLLAGADADSRKMFGIMMSLIRVWNIDPDRSAGYLQIFHV